MAVEIRRLSVADYDEIVQVWLDAGLPYKPHGRERREILREEMMQPFCAFFGLYEDDRLIGVSIANWDGRRGWINRLAIDPDCRGRGLASKLIKECERFLEAQRAMVIAALIEEENLPSMAAFNKAGYVCMPEVKYFSKRKSKEA